MSTATTSVLCFPGEPEAMRGMKRAVKAVASSFLVSGVSDSIKVARQPRWEPGLHRKSVK